MKQQIGSYLRVSSEHIIVTKVNILLTTEYSACNLAVFDHVK